MSKRQFFLMSLIGLSMVQFTVAMHHEDGDDDSWDIISNEGSEQAAQRHLQEEELITKAQKPAQPTLKDKFVNFFKGTKPADQPKTLKLDFSKDSSGAGDFSNVESWEIFVDRSYFNPKTSPEAKNVMEAQAKKELQNEQKRLAGIAKMIFNFQEDEKMNEARTAIASDEAEARGTLQSKKEDARKNVQNYQIMQKTLRSKVIELTITKVSPLLQKKQYDQAAQVFINSLPRQDAGQGVLSFPRQEFDNLIKYNITFYQDIASGVTILTPRTIDYDMVMNIPDDALQNVKSYVAYELKTNGMINLRPYLDNVRISRENFETIMQATIDAIQAAKNKILQQQTKSSKNLL